MFRQSVHEEWVLPSHYVGAHTVKNYIKFQVGLTLQLAIFPLKSKYKDTDVWNLTYWVLCFGNQLLKNEFCQVLMFDLIVYDNILYLKLDWRSNKQYSSQSINTKIQMFETWHIGFYVSAIGSWRICFAKPLHWSSYRKKLYKIPSWTNDAFSNIPIIVQIQRYRCLKLDTLFFMFRQSALEEWDLPSFNVWPHSLR